MFVQEPFAFWQITPNYLRYPKITKLRHVIQLRLRHVYQLLRHLPSWPRGPHGSAAWPDVKYVKLKATGAQDKQGIIGQRLGFCGFWDVLMSSGWRLLLASGWSTHFLWQTASNWNGVCCYFDLFCLLMSFVCFILNWFVESQATSPRAQVFKI